MLIGAARYLAETRRFDGTAVLIFQPGEEGFAGAKAMIEDGLLERFPVQSVYAMHNWPQMRPGTVGVNPGPMRAAADRITIEAEQGEMLSRTVAKVMAKLHTVETLLSDSTTKPSGDLRITAAIGLGTVWVTQRLREFMELYPEIRIDLNLNDEQVDLSKRAADVALWTREPDQTDLIRRPLFSMKVRAYASATYVRRFGAPTSVNALDHHRILSYSGVPAQHLAAITWIETVGRDDQPPRVPVFRANSVVALKYAVRAGIGIGMIPDYMLEEESDLVTVLTEIDPPTLPILWTGIFCAQQSVRHSRYCRYDSQTLS